MKKINVDSGFGKTFDELVTSLVNGIALALGSKTNVLGRAQDIGEFIRTGQDKAELEIELLNALEPDKNYVINRKIIR